MTTFELAKLIRNSGCTISISPFEMYNAVDITVRNKDRFVQHRLAMESAFSDSEEIFDWTIEMSVNQVKDF
jgi:hypothetical protein